MCAPPTQKKERQASIFSYFIDRVHIKKDCFSRSLIQSLSLSLTHSDRACFLRTTVPYSHWLLSFSFPTFQDTTSSPSTLSLSLSLSLCCAIESPPRGRQALLLYQVSMVSFFTSRFVFLFPPVTSFLYPISNGFQKCSQPAPSIPPMSLFHHRLRPTDPCSVAKLVQSLQALHFATWHISASFFSDLPQPS